MPRFAYSARDRSGKAVSDSFDAASRKDAVRLLAARGLQIASLTEQASANAKPAAKGKAKKNSAAAAAANDSAAGTGGFSFLGTSDATAPRRHERLPFLEALHDLTSSGLSAGEAVRLLAMRLKDPRLRTLSAGLWERISEGAPLSRAMAEFPVVFDTGTTNLIQAGEATGSLNDTLARIIGHLTEQKELRRQLVSALAYPIFMVFVAIGVIFFFLFFLLPRLQSLLSSLGGKMPLPTKILIGVADFSLHYGLFVVIALVFFAVSFWRWRSTAAGLEQTDGWLLKVPLVGPFIVAQTILAFSQTLSVLLENGITTAEALKMTERQIQNLVHRRAFVEATARILEGEALSLALQRTGCFPDLVLDRLAVGENTGNVVPSLKDIAKAYRKNISSQLNMFTGVIATGVLMSVFIFVGFIAYAIVSAVFTVSASFKIG